MIHTILSIVYANTSLSKVLILETKTDYRTGDAVIRIGQLRILRPG